MKILSMDASHKHIYIAYQEKSFKLLLSQPLEKAEILPFYLQEALREHNLEINSIQRVGLITGPGNYTSLRASILLARSFAWLYNIKIVAKTRLEVLFYLHRSQNQPILVNQSVRQGQFYTALGQYQDTGISYTIPPKICNEEELAHLVEKHTGPIFGDWQKGTSSPEVSDTPMAEQIIQALSQWTIQSSETSSFEDIKPFYIRPAVVPSKGK